MLALCKAMLYLAGMDSKPNGALASAVDVLGGVSALATALDISSAAVHQWLNGDRPLPLERCAEIERMTNGTVTCEELRPDKADFFRHFRSTKPADPAPATEAV